MKYRIMEKMNVSQLLLHHVIPGAFQMDSLQDEMTGVSLAGTQLRVNVYDMHDHEWNDVEVSKPDDFNEYLNFLNFHHINRNS